MQCRYCGANNSGSARVCAACSKPLQISGFPEKPARLDDACTTHRNYPALSHLQFSTRFRTEQYWRTRHLTGFMPSIPSTQASDAAATASASPNTSNYRRYEPAGATQQRPLPEHPAQPRQGTTIPPESHPVNDGQDRGASQRLHTRLAPRRAISRVVLMAAIFVVGTAVGLGASWWMRHSAAPAPVSVAKIPRPASAAPAVKPSSGNRTVAVRGISPSELPYDGAPPPATVEAQRTPDTAPAVPLHDVMPESSRPESGPSSGDSAPESETVQEASSEPAPAQRDPHDAEKVPGPASTAASANLPAKATRHANAADRDTKAAQNKAAQKRRASAKIAKDREIERIKQQADEELQRKLEIGRAAEEARARKRLAGSLRNKGQAVTVSESRAVRVRKVLAKCERMTNLFRREQCKWRLCGNMWGKYGCPSYSRQVSTY